MTTLSRGKVRVYAEPHIVDAHDHEHKSNAYISFAWRWAKEGIYPIQEPDTRCAANIEQRL